MCGFAGFCGEVPHREALLRAMTDAIAHRGPDSDGFFFDGRFALGFRRLAILDLRPEGNQPMVSRDGRVALVYNGELYNYTELRARLRGKGYRFRTHGDTEVLLCAYLEYGVEVVHHLRGMFAFAIRDLRSDTLFCARDFFGIKPFYYTLCPDGAFLFGSEIKSLLCHPSYEQALNPHALRAYLTFQHAACRETFFSGIYRLPPAHTLLYANGEITVRPYDKPTLCPDGDSFAAHVEALCARMEDSVQKHRRSDVEVGAFLSGGVDSSYLCALARPHHTFSVGFCEATRFDEIPLARATAEALGITHHHRYLCADECFDAFSDMQYHLDEPHANPSVLPLWFLAREAARYVRVVLSGEGADELFGGYDAYLDSALGKRYKRLPAWLRRTVSSSVAPLPSFRGQGFLTLSDSRPERHYVGQAWIFSPEESARLLRYPYCAAPSALSLTYPYFHRYRTYTESEQKQLLDLHFWLPNDILQKADKMSMAASLELRVPYLDREVYALACRLRSEEKIIGTRSKCILRHAAARYLPDEVAYRQKKGFPVPIRLWLRQAPYYERLADAFSCAFAADFFDTDYLRSLLRAHRDGNANHARKLWCAYTFLVWYQRYFQKEATL